MAPTAHDMVMVVPTRGRPQNAVDLWMAWREVTSPRTVLCFVIDDDDEYRLMYVNSIQAMPNAIYVEILNATGDGMVGALNSAVERLLLDDYKYIGFMGDDHRPRTHDWDERLIEVLLLQGTGVAYGNDLLQCEAMPTAVVMTANIPRTLGYMSPPQLKHLCVDLVWKDWGVGIDRLTYLDDVVIEHMHPANGKAPMDPGYARVNSYEVTSKDALTYYDYRDNGGLAADVEKLRSLL